MTHSKRTLQRLVDDTSLQDGLRRELEAASSERPSEEQAYRILAAMLPTVAAIGGATAAASVGHAAVTAGSASTSIAPLATGATTAGTATASKTGVFVKLLALAKSTPLFVSTAISVAGVAGTTAWVIEQKTAKHRRSDRIAISSAKPRPAQHHAPRQSPVSVPHGEAVKNPVTDTATPTALADPTVHVGRRARSAHSDSPVAPEPETRAPNGLNEAPAENATNYDLINLAQRTLRAHPAWSLALCKLHQKRFGDDEFAQERERIAIEALVKLHDLQEARSRANNFKRVYPGSVYTQRIEELIREPATNPDPP